ncbi:sugar transferase [Eisenibacter elegans]|uniref:sugar transferase n=1 Tax=Eisenibacter elegans TaxID=997 RepID=UPI0006848438|nr:sugar transferase [Eisenibacter elegans]
MHQNITTHTAYHTRWFFVQQRIGKGERPFWMYKFRTMREAYNAQGVPLPDELRLTPWGRWLRKYSFDELPQLWNILRGDMRLVGPRPLPVAYLSKMTPEQRRRHHVKPGLTGWAQIHGRNALPWESRFALDVWYVQNRSLLLDIYICWQTWLQWWRNPDGDTPGQVL